MLQVFGFIVIGIGDGPRVIQTPAAMSRTTFVNWHDLHATTASAAKAAKVDALVPTTVAKIREQTLTLAQI